MSGPESVPTTWDDARDEPFFRITAHVLECQLVEAGSALLAAADADAGPEPSPTPDVP